jgi:hypothetical protein
MSDPRAPRLQELIHRRDKVLAVLHPPSTAHARIMGTGAQIRSQGPAFTIYFKCLVT